MELDNFDLAIKNYEKSAQRSIEIKKTSSKVEAFTQIVKAHIIKNKGENENDYKKYIDEIMNVSKDDPSNKKVNFFRKGLTDFIEFHRQKIKAKEANPYLKLDSD